MPVSLLTALARLDIDAWEEAADLARQSSESATETGLAAHDSAERPEPGEAVRVATPGRAAARNARAAGSFRRSATAQSRGSAVQESGT